MQAMDLGRRHYHARARHGRGRRRQCGGGSRDSLHRHPGAQGAGRSRCFEVVAADGTTTTPQALNAEADGTTDDSTAFVAFDPNTAELVRTTPADALILNNIMSPSFTRPVPGSPSVSHSFLQDTDTETDGNQFAMVAGTYNGAMGTYACATAATCTVAVNAMGQLTSFSDGWIFTPADGATSDQPDYDYLNYGFWLKRTTDKDGVLTYNEVETFAGSSMNASGALTSVLGTATYNGGRHGCVCP